MSDFTSPVLQQISETNYNVTHGTDRGLIAMFSNEAVEDTEASLREGRPIYKNVEFITISFPADNTKQLVRPVIYESTMTQPSDLERFPKQWAAFKAQQQDVHDGMPLTQWAALSKAQVMELKGMNIHTVEQLAAVADMNLKWMGAREMRENARVWLEEAENGSAVNKLHNENKSLRMEIEALKNQMKGFASELKVDIQPISEEVNEQKVNIQVMKPRMKKHGANTVATDAASGE